MGRSISAAVSEGGSRRATETYKDRLIRSLLDNVEACKCVSCVPYTFIVQELILTSPSDWRGEILADISLAFVALLSPVESYLSGSFSSFAQTDATFYPK